MRWITCEIKEEKDCCAQTTLSLSGYAANVCLTEKKSFFRLPNHTGRASPPRPLRWWWIHKRTARIDLVVTATSYVVRNRAAFEIHRPRITERRGRVSQMKTTRAAVWQSRLTISGLQNKRNDQTISVGTEVTNSLLHNSQLSFLTDSLN